MNIRGGTDGWTPLFYAAIAGHSSLVEFLLSVGANTEVIFFGSIFQIHVCCMGAVEIINLRYLYDQELDNAGQSVEGRVQGAVDEMEDRLKQLQNTTPSPAMTPEDAPATKTLQLPLNIISRQVTTLH